MCLKLTYALLMLVFTANSMEIYPNEGNIKIFRSGESEIKWEDPKHLVPDEIKNKIALLLPMEGKTPTGKTESSNDLFQSICDWTVRGIHKEALPILNELMFTLSEHVKVEVTEEERPNRTPLMLAAYFDMENAVKKLLERNAPTDDVSRDDNTALHWAAKSNYLVTDLRLDGEVFDHFLKYKERMNELIVLEETSKLLSRPTSYQDSRVCRILIEKGAVVDARTKEFGLTPLMYAAMQGNVGAVAALLENGADAELKTKEKEDVKQFKKHRPSSVNFELKAHVAKNIMETHQDYCLRNEFKKHIGPSSGVKKTTNEESTVKATKIKEEGVDYKKLELPHLTNAPQDKTALELAQKLFDKNRINAIKKLFDDQN